MSLVSTTIPNLINGVSQQPNALRLASQCELQENCNSSVVDGLTPRNGIRHSAKITSTPLTNAFTHLINRDQTERYRVIAANNGIKVYDLAGNQKTVNYGPGAVNYITSATPAEDLVALTVADYTFILNKKMVVQQNNTDLVPARPTEALLWVKQAVQDSTYTFTVDGHKASRVTGDAQNSPNSVATDAIANALVNGASVSGDVGLIAALGASAGQYTIQLNGSAIRVAKVDGSDFSVASTDSFGDQATSLIKGTTQRFTNLPAKGFPGFKVEVQGEGGSFNTSYWVEFIADANNPYGGVWKEGTKPGEAKSLLASTMPHVLVREADGTFTLKAADWEPRKVGDLTKTNPMPSFVGRKINDIFFHRNRLGFLSDEGMIMSVAGDYFNFFKGSAIQVLDTDPIDIAVSNTKVAVLEHAVPWHETLLMFSDQTQFILGKTTDTLTVKTASIDPTTDFECSSSVKPISVGKFVYFVQHRDKFSLVREFLIDAYTQTKDAQDITSHVPKYLPDGVFKLAASNTESIMVALSHGAPNKLFIYQYYVSGESKLQSAWHTWTLGANDTILNADFIESELHLIVSRPDGVYLEVMTVTANSFDGDQKFSARLDRQIDETKVSGLTYNSTTNRTSFTLPYAPLPDEKHVLVAWSGNDDFKTGQKVRFSVSGATVTVTSDGNLKHFRFGRTFKARYVFSQLEVREQTNGGGQTVVAEGRINVRRMTLTYGKSGYFRVEVTPRGRDTYTNVMSGRVVGNSNSLLGQVSLIEGVFRVPVMARNIDVNIELVSDEFLPFAILSADWEAMFVVRSRRI